MLVENSTHQPRTCFLPKSLVQPKLKFEMSQPPNSSEFNYLPLSSEEYQLLQGTEGMPEPSNFLQHLLTHTNDNGNMMNVSDAEYTSNSLQFLNGNQSIPQQSHRGADQSSFYSNSSPQNDQQYHTFNSMSGMYHSPNHAGISSPMTPTSPKKSPVGQAGERRFTYPASSQSIAPYSQMNHAATTSPTIQALPETSKFPGIYGFELSFGPPTEGATKSIDYTYSHNLGKLYVQRGAHCPFKFKSEKMPPEGSHIKVLPVFKGTHVLSEPVKRCSNHAVSEEEAGNFDGKARYHFVRSDNALTNYETLENGRLCVSFPFTGPQVGAEYQTELLSFQCFNSCGYSAHAKRRIDVIFTLEHGNQVLGRQVIEVRVCACPGRDRQNEEQNALCGQRKRRTSQNVTTIAKRKKGANNSEMYVVKTPSAHVYDILLRIQKLLESVVDNQTLEGQSRSPPSVTSSPHPTRIQTVPESESEGE